MGCRLPLIVEKVMGLIVVELGAGAGAAVVTLLAFCGGAAGRPLIGLRPNSAAKPLGMLSGRVDAEGDGE
jgi:hypothetical protein